MNLVAESQVATSRFGRQGKGTKVAVEVVSLLSFVVRIWKEAEGIVLSLGCQPPLHQFFLASFSFDFPVQPGFEQQLKNLFNVGTT